MNKRVYLECLLGLISLFALAACAGGSPTAAPAPQNTALPPTGYPAEPTTVPVITEGYPAVVNPTAALPEGYPGQPTPAAATRADSFIALAKNDLAQRLSVAADQISVISAEATDWPDASIGCPKAGSAYAQVITPGYRIGLEQAQKQYEYHTDLKGQFVLCSP
jgi:hypothetical protein